MPACRAIVMLLTMLIAAPILAEPLRLEAGLVVEPPAALDWTYQIIKANDPNKKVIATWNGDKLEYFVSVSKLPPGWLDAKTYLTGFTKDLRNLSVPQKFELLRQGTYAASGGLTGHFVEAEFTVRGTDVSQHKIFHHLADSNSSYLAIATLIDPASADRMLDESAAILKTATTSAPMAELVSHEYDPFLGKWSAREAVPGGRSTEALIELKSDLTFTTTVSVDSKPILQATGIWSLKDNVLTWNYLNSIPALPEDAKIDADEIVSADGHRLSLRSKRSGAVHQYERAD
jgi:hypothetical protein